METFTFLILVSQTCLKDLELGIEIFTFPTHTATKIK